jgi:hypothetical protein
VFLERIPQALGHPWLDHVLSANKESMLINQALLTALMLLLVMGSLPMRQRRRQQRPTVSVAWLQHVMES